jgi:hypothetical protein
MGATAAKPAMPTFQLAQPAARATSSFTSIAGALVLLIVVFALVIYASRSMSTSVGAATANDLVPTETDGKSGTKMASGVSGTNTSLQFWMYIKDWDYKFGSKKRVIDISNPAKPSVMTPGVSLHPTDNSLDIDVPVYSSKSSLATSNTGSGEVQTVTVENVPLQSWFAVSVTIFQRNVDVYINGRLVKSAILAGIPKPAAGDITIGGGGGFSGSVCTVHATSSQITPPDAAAFYAAGTACAGAGSASASADKTNSMTLFGYTFIFGVKDSAGKDVTGLSSSDVSNWFYSTKK